MIFQAAQNVFIQRKERRKEKKHGKKTNCVYIPRNK